MSVWNTRMVPAGLGILEAAGLLQAGEVVAFPTETVYGLGGDARRDDAIQKIYAAKDRPSNNPLIVHVPDLDEARACARPGAWPEAAEQLGKRFWPGPLTLVVPRGEGISKLVSAGRDTVALRCPNHAVAEALLRTFKGPVAAPSANRSGFTSPTSAEHVHAELGGRIPLILDGGSCRVGVESTVLDVSGAAQGRQSMILRHGGVTREMIEAVIGPVDVFSGHVKAGVAAASPGLLARHYAPRTRAFRFSAAQWPQVRQRAEGGPRLVLLSYDPRVALGAPHDTLLLPGEAAAYAHELYGALRAADRKEASSILVLMPDKEEGMWAAVRDRLRRATVEMPEETRQK